MAARGLDRVLLTGQLHDNEWTLPGLLDYNSTECQSIIQRRLLYNNNILIDRRHTADSSWQRLNFKQPASSVPLNPFRMYLTMTLIAFLELRLH